MPEPKDELKQLSKAYKDIFSGESGKLVLEDIKAQGFFNDSTWAGTKEETLLNEGRRQLALHINTIIETDLAELEKMFEEQEEEKF